MNVNKLKGKIVEYGYTGKTFEEAMGISHAAFYRKMNNISEFTLGELQKIVKLLSLSADEIIDIFFTIKVA